MCVFYLQRVALATQWFIWIPLPLVDEMSIHSTFSKKKKKKSVHFNVIELVNDETTFYTSTAEDDQEQKPEIIKIQ